jgi:hypothetical protein
MGPVATWSLPSVGHRFKFRVLLKSDDVGDRYTSVLPTSVSLSLLYCPTTLYHPAWLFPLSRFFLPLRSIGYRGSLMSTFVRRPSFQTIFKSSTHRSTTSTHTYTLVPERDPRTRRDDKIDGWSHTSIGRLQASLLKWDINQVHWSLMQVTTPERTLRRCQIR